MWHEYRFGVQEVVVFTQKFRWFVRSPWAGEAEEGRGSEAPRERKEVLGEGGGCEEKRSGSLGREAGGIKKKGRREEEGRVVP